MTESALASAVNNPQGPEVSFRTQNILPPGAEYVSADDVLALQWFLPFFLSTGNLTLTLRLLSPQGTVVMSVYTVNMATAPANPLIIQPSEGFLLSATVISDVVARGQTFVRLAIIRGAGGLTGGQGQILLQGYPTAIGWLAYPNTPLSNPQDGQGMLTVAGITNPAAGADWTITVFSGGVWKLLQAQGTLTTSAVVAVRFPTLVITPPTMLPIAQFASATLPASSSDAFIWAVGKQNSTVANVVITTMLPDMLLVPNTVIKVQTANIQAADQWSSITLVFEHFIAG